jgi:hypothetical protein
MSSTATTAHEFEHFEQNVVQRDRYRSTADGEVDQVIQASRLADSTVPDGGYGWIVVLGCAILAWWAVGTSYCWGVIQSALVEEGLSSPAKLSFVGSVATASLSAFALINSRLVRLLGTRYVGILGISLMGVSELLSSFATHNIGGLFMTAGVMMGLGMRWVIQLLQN